MSAKATDDQVLAISKGYYIIYQDKNTGEVGGWVPQTLQPTISRDVADRYEEGEKPEAFSMAWVNTLLTPSPRRTLEDMNWILKSLSEVGDMDTTSIRVFTPASQEDAAVFRDTLGVEESRAVSFASMVKYLAENPEDLELLFCWYMKYSSTQPDLLARMLVASKAASRENLLFMARSWSGKMELRGKKIIHALENQDVVLLDPMDVLVNEIVSGSFYVEIHDHQIISTISKSPELTSDHRAKTAVQEWFGPILDKGYLSDADLVASREGGYLSGFERNCLLALLIERNCLLALQRRGFLEKGTKALDVGSISLRALEWPTGHTLEDAHLVFPDDNEMKRGLASLLAHVKAHPEDFHLLIRFAASRTDVDIIPKLVKAGVISRDDVVGSLSNLRGKGESALQSYVSSLEAKFAKLASKAYRRNLMKLTESRWIIHSMGSHGSMFFCSGLSEEKAQKWLADLGLDGGSEVITKERLLECRNRVASSFDEIAIVRALISDLRVEHREESFKTFYIKPDEYFGLRQPTIVDLNYTSKFRDQSNKLGWSLAASIHATLSEGTIGAKDILEASSSYFNDVCEVLHFLSEAGSDIRVAIVDDLMSSTRPDIVAVGVKLNEKFRVADSDFDQTAKDLRESSKGKEVTMTNTTESNTFKKGVVDDKLDTSNWGPIGGFGPKIVTLADLENFLSVPVTFLGNYGFVTASLAAEEAKRAAKELLYLFSAPPGTRTLSNADVWGWMYDGDSSTTDDAKKIALCCLAREGYLRDNWAEYLEVKYIKDILPRAKTMDLPAMRSLFQENGLGFEMEDFGVNLTVYLRMMESQDKIPDLVSAVGGIGDSLFEKRAEVLGLIVREMVRHGGLSVSRLEQSIQRLTAHQSATLQNVGASIRLLAQAVEGAKFKMAVEMEPSIAERVRGLVKKDILDPKADSKDGVDVEAKRAFAEANRQLIQYLKTEDWFFTGDELVGLPGMENGKAEKIAEVVGLLKVTTGQRDPASSAKVVESLTQLTKGQIGHVKKIVTTLLRLGIEPDAVVMKEIFQSEKIELLPHGTLEEDWELANAAFPGTVISQQVSSVAAYFLQCGREGLVPQLAKLIHCDTDTTHWLPKLIHVSIDRGILDADKILDYAKNVLRASDNIHEYSFGSELEDYLTHRSGKTASKETKGDDMTPGMAALQYLHRSKGEVKVALQKEVDEGRQTETWRDKVIAHLTSEEEYQRNLEAVVADALRDSVEKNTPETRQAIVDAAVTRLVSMFEQDPPSVEPIGHVADSAIPYEEMYRQIHYAYERKVHRRPVQHPAESYRKLMDLESKKLNYLFGSESLKKAVSAVDQALNPGVVSPSERVAMEKKAAKCLAIAQWMYGKDANVKELEDKAFALMDLPYHHIESLHNHIKTKVGSLDTGKAAVDAGAALSSVGKAAVGVGAAMLGAMSETTTDEIEDVKAKVKEVKAKMTPKTTMGSAKVKANSAMDEEEEGLMDDSMESDEDEGGSKTNVGQILIRTLKDDGKTIALRTGVKHTREQLTSLVTNFINSKSIRRYEGESDEAYAARAEAQRSGVSAFLLSDVGQQVITYLLGLSWPVLEDNIEDKRVRKYGGMVAAEIRAQSGSDLLDGFLEEVVFPLLAVITAEAKNFGKMVLAPAKKVRVQPHFGESVEDEKARLMERLAELEREANVVPLAKNRQ